MLSRSRFVATNLPTFWSEGRSHVPPEVGRTWKQCRRAPRLASLSVAYGEPGGGPEGP